MAELERAVLVTKPQKDHEQRVRSETLAFREINAAWREDGGMELYLHEAERGWDGHWVGLHIDMAPRDAHALAIQIEACLQEKRTELEAVLATLSRV